ncbi:hypothetical protein H9P43_000713 [Blastocladiella emersonii ATCC 22665]|nr:hypothetical protein H9P43_000713 [Blastocladiella emersonii ATCC 22665]
MDRRTDCIADDAVALADSPLAAYLAEFGLEGELDTAPVEDRQDDASCTTTAFAWESDLEELERPVAVRKLARDWETLNGLFTARFRYLREVDVVSRGYQLHAQHLPPVHRSQDSMRALSVRRQLIDYLTSVLETATAAMAVVCGQNPDLDASVASLVSTARTAPTLQAVRELLESVRAVMEIVVEVSDASTEELQRLASAMDNAIHGLQAILDGS